MKPFVIFLCILAVAFLITLPLQLRIRRNMRCYWDRACTGFQWRRRFPESPKTEIREFLSMFVDAFAFRQSQRCCFSPDDRVMEIYRMLYPDKFMADALELETLASHLRKRYGVDAAKFWREDITLGEIYEQTHRVA
jgi:hypothetical protein